MPVEVLCDENFRSALESEERAVVDFFATWCGQCTLMKPKFQRLAQDMPHVRFFLVDGEAAPEARRTVQIPNLPFFAMYRNGVQVDGLFTTKIEGLRDKLVEVFGPPPGAAS